MTFSHYPTKIIAENGDLQRLSQGWNAAVIHNAVWRTARAAPKRS
jgi:hypothetical protein